MARTFSETEQITLAHNADQFGMAAVTTACWFNYTARGTSGGYFWTKRYANTSAVWGFILRQPVSDIILTGAIRTGSESVAEGTTALNTSQWYHAMMRYDGTDHEIYLDGVLEGSDTNSGSINSGGSADNDIGVASNAKDPDNNRFIAGEVCECAMWDRALSDAELQAVFRYGNTAVRNSMVILMPINGNPTTELEYINNRGDVTHINSPAKGDHAPIPVIGPSKAASIIVPSFSPPPVGGLSIPVAMYNYRRMRVS